MDKFPAIIPVVFENLLGVLRFLRTYCTVSRRIPNGIPTNNRLETLTSIDGIYEQPQQITEIQTRYYYQISKYEIYALFTTKEPMFVSDYNKINFIATFP
jgi:hypothetical protein